MLRTLLPQSTALTFPSLTTFRSATGTLSRFTPGLITCSLCLFLGSLLGCRQEESVRTYVIPTEMPAELRPGKERMLGAIVPRGDQTWFFKVMGPAGAIDAVAATFREFVAEVEFVDGDPDLSELPEDWQLAGEKPFRFASINIETPQKQLDLSISKLSRQEDWEREVEMNVNRWRGQLGLEPSQETWAGAESIDIAASDGESKLPAIWVDLVGQPSTGSGPAMMPPMMGAAPTMAPTASSPPPTTSPAPADESPQSRFQFTAPESWREGKMSSMRWAAFNVGPEDAVAEVTVIPAGGDERGNVQRWIGQIRSDVTDAIVDQAMESAESIQVGGRDANRYTLVGDQEAAAGQGVQAIDATIVPLESNFSLFIKMTGPAATVTEQHDALTSFLESLEF